MASPADGAGAMGERCWRAPPLLPGASAAGPRLTLPALPAGRCRRLYCAGTDAQSQEGQGQGGSNFLLPVVALVDDTDDVAVSDCVTVTDNDAAAVSDYVTVTDDDIAVSDYVTDTDDDVADNVPDTDDDVAVSDCY